MDRLTGTRSPELVTISEGFESSRWARVPTTCPNGRWDESRHVADRLNPDARLLPWLREVT